MLSRLSNASWLVAFALFVFSAKVLADDPAANGPYHVGSVTFDITDSDRDNRLLRTEVWYPTLDRVVDLLPAPRYPSGVRTNAYRSARPARGPFPVVLFSHGLAATREQSTFITEHLASRGYIVISPDHQYNTGRDLRPLEIHQSLLDRPMDLRVVLDWMIAKSRSPDDPFFGRLDTSKVAAVGHSLGGCTALIVAGAWINPHKLPIKRTTEADYLDRHDPRIRAVVAYAPVRHPGFDDRGLAEVHVPVLIVGGTADNVTSPAEHQRPIFERLRCDRWLAEIRGATHFNFNNDEMIDEAPFFIRGLHRPMIDRKAADDIVRRLTLAFLERHLRGNDAYAEQLRDQKDVTVVGVGTAVVNRSGACRSRW